MFIVVTLLSLSLSAASLVTVKKASDMAALADGKTIKLIGRVSNVQWQHIIKAPVSHPNTTLLDNLDIQTVVYSAKPIKCTGKIAIKGTVTAIEGLDKGGAERKLFKEYHLLAQKWKCLK